MSVGPVMKVKLSDWQAAAAADRDLTFKLPMNVNDGGLTTYLFNEISGACKSSFDAVVRGATSPANVNVSGLLSASAWTGSVDANLQRLAVWVRYNRTLGLPQPIVQAQQAYTNQNQVDQINALFKTIFNATSINFVEQYNGMNAPLKGHGYDGPLPVPRTIQTLQAISAGGGYLLSKEILDGKYPIAKTYPPFDDGDRPWGLFVAPINGAWSIAIRRMNRTLWDAISYASGQVWDVLKAGLEYACEGITWDKLSDVRTYGTLVPEPHVQAVVAAWQVAATACGMAFPPAITVEQAQQQLPAQCKTPPPPEPPKPFYKQAGFWIASGALASLATGTYFLFTKS